MPDPTATEPLIDPDCRDGKCGSCVGGPCEHWCHTHGTRTPADEERAAKLRDEHGPLSRSRLRREAIQAGRTPPDDTTKTVHPEVLKEIVFGTRIARSMENESPAVIIQTTAERIWSNLSSYLAVGDWPDRCRTAEEVDAEAEAEAAAARRPPSRARRGRRKSDA